MEIRNCNRCGHVFSGFGKMICPACEKQEEETFRKVKDYINDNPQHTLQEVSDTTEVSMKKILRYIKEGRIIISPGASSEIACERCGKPINSGRYCESCIIKVHQQVDEVFGRGFKSDNKHEGAKMHIRQGRKV